MEQSEEYKDQEECGAKEKHSSQPESPGLGVAPSPYPTNLCSHVLMHPSTFWWPSLESRMAKYDNTLEQWNNEKKVYYLVTYTHS